MNSLGSSRFHRRISRCLRRSSSAASGLRPRSAGPTSTPPFETPGGWTDGPRRVGVTGRRGWGPRRGRGAAPPAWQEKGADPRPLAPASVGSKPWQLLYRRWSSRASLVRSRDLPFDWSRQCPYSPARGESSLDGSYGTPQRRADAECRPGRAPVPYAVPLARRSTRPYALRC